MTFLSLFMGIIVFLLGSFVYKFKVIAGTLDQSFKEYARNTRMD